MPKHETQPTPASNSSSFSQTTTDFWQAPFVNGSLLYHDEEFTIIINSDLSEDNRVMVLETTDGKVSAVLTPALADKAGLTVQEELTEAIFRQKLNGAGITLHGADYLFYFTEEDKHVLEQETVKGDLRQLTVQDDVVFSEFQASASEQDLDDAYVELDHWAVFGSFDQHNLVCAASMYPWENAQIADIGVLTLIAYRGKGHARNVVRSISRYACKQGYEPQYRCQLDNYASTSLAKAAGLTLFGKWEVVSPESAN
ncbi:GNAT family N-acetyltransferase [Paenibacillus sp. ACRRX]|uniref:GNAT family N-acetyltransferase n=1 Tax=Paenibacillus sp. ACRRX TaxID=2918206 RepID=UPI001EF5F044|nr:GNAT family N-acetyltransferase [Paenibacillus sp. ACRRX]MCG7407026.1 GNAT family N-acetyltransferase [Paenibacillus sp. ACRRX]